MEKSKLPEKNSLHEIHLKIPTEVLSTHYILKTEQNQYLLQLSKFLSSVIVLILNTTGLVLSSFLIFWWNIKYPTGEKDIWFYVLIFLIYAFLGLEILIVLVLTKIQFRYLFLFILIISGGTLVVISCVLSESFSFYLMDIGILISFISLSINLALNFINRMHKKSEENFAQKMMKLYILQDESKENKAYAHIEENHKFSLNNLEE